MLNRTPLLALMTDLYEITMAQGYWKEKMEEDEAVFHLFFRKQPFQGNYAVAAGLERVIEYVKDFHFTDEEINYLRTLKMPRFESDFLDYLKNLRLTCDIDAVAEGQVVFPYEPLLRVKGPIIQCQLLESLLLNLINFPTLIATKAARICQAAAGDEVIEFGLRRAQGIDGALTASRASFIGGCSATSNTLAGLHFGIPVKGTHAHSWVMAFPSEQEAFEAYARAFPEQALFLVDTYDSLEGVNRAIAVGHSLREQGKKMVGIRLDSGDLAYLSKESRRLLDEAGFPEAQIVASNELNEYLIADLKQQGAKVSVWGVGTHLVTGHPQGAIDGVYKIAAIRKKGEAWRYCLKLSERMSKISDPGILQVRRFYSKESSLSVADAIYDVQSDLSKGCMIVDPLDISRKRNLSHATLYEDLLQPIFREGKLLYQPPPLAEIRKFCQHNLRRFDPTVMRFYNPHTYPVGLEKELYNLKLNLIEKERRNH